MRNSFPKEDSHEKESFKPVFNACFLFDHAATAKLLKDCTLDDKNSSYSGIDLEGTGSVTLDLNGRILSQHDKIAKDDFGWYQSIVPLESGSLTIEDSKVSDRIVQPNGGTLNGMCGVAMYGTSAAPTVTGGAITGTSSISLIVYGNTATKKIGTVKIDITVKVCGTSG